MSKALEPHRTYQADMACGDTSDSSQARMLSEIAAADDMANAGIVSGLRHVRRSSHPWPPPLQIEFGTDNAGRRQTPGHRATAEV